MVITLGDNFIFKVELARCERFSRFSGMAHHIYAPVVRKSRLFERHKWNKIYLQSEAEKQVAIHRAKLLNVPRPMHVLRPYVDN
jgi:hypothetical protein